MPHMEHLKGLSPVCVLMWISSAEPEQKFLAHTRHTCRLAAAACPLAAGGAAAGGDSEAGVAPADRGEEGGRPARASVVSGLGQLG